MEETINIFAKDGKVRIKVDITQKDIYHKELMGEEYVLLSFVTVKPIELQKGDFIDIDLGRFELIKVEEPTFDTMTGGYHYEQKFYASYAKWANRIFKFFNDAVNTQETSFTLTQTPAYFLDMVVKNVKENGFGDMTYTFDSSFAEMKTIKFESSNILDALSKIAEAWETEWWITDNVIHLSRCEYGSPVRLAHGEALSEITSESAKDERYVTRLYAFGSEKNLPVNYRDNMDNVTEGTVIRRLHMPKGTDYVDAWENMAEEDVVEGVTVFDNIFPRQNGTITFITTKQYTDIIKNEDGSETEEKWNAFRFRDGSITFKKEYLLNDKELKVVFQSGKLAGMTFGVAFNPDGKPEDSYDAQIFEIIRSEENGISLPSDAFRPEVGDSYVFVGLDTKFIDENLLASAEFELKEEAQKTVIKLSSEKPSFTCRTNVVWCAGYRNKIHDVNNEIDLGVGQRVEIINEAGKAYISRIRGFEKQLDIRYECSYMVGESSRYSKSEELNNKIEALGKKTESITAIGNGIYLIKRYDRTAATDFNAYSALRSNLEFLSKTRPDATRNNIDFIGGIGAEHIYSLDRTGKTTFKQRGLEGAGFGLYTDENDDTHLEVDYVSVRKNFEVSVIDIKKETFSGGNINLTEANGTIYRVYAYDDNGYNFFNVFTGKNAQGKDVAIAMYDKDFVKILGHGVKKPVEALSKASSYKIYFEKTDGKATVEDMWHNGDMALVKDLNLTKDSMRTWHRVVTKHGIENLEDKKPYNYIVVSNSDELISVTSESGNVVNGVMAYDTSIKNDTPIVGDKVVQYGSVTEILRQGLTRIDSRGDGNGGMYVVMGVGHNKGSVAQFRHTSAPIVITPNEVNIVADHIKFVVRDENNQIIEEVDAQELISTIEQKADQISLKVGLDGARNLLQGTKYLRGPHIFLPEDCDSHAKYKDFKVVGKTFVDTEYVDMITYKTLHLMPSTVYTLSFMYLGNTDTTFETYIYSADVKVCEYVKNNQTNEKTYESDGHSHFKVGNINWNLGTVEFKTTDLINDETEVTIIVGRLMNMGEIVNYGNFCAPKLEYGDKATQWRPSDDDSVSDGQLLDTGIDIYHKKIVITSDKVVVQNNKGTETAMIDADGKIRTQLINSDEVVTNGLKSKLIEADDAVIENINLMGSSRIGGFGVMAQTPWMMHNIDYRWIDSAGNVHEWTERDRHLMMLEPWTLSFEYYRDKINNPYEPAFRKCVFGQADLSEQMIDLSEENNSPSIGKKNIRGIRINVPKTSTDMVDDVNAPHNDALYLTHGTVCGWRPRLRRVVITQKDQEVNITREDYTILLKKEGSGNAIINLPAGSAIDDGQRIEIRACDAVDNSINAGVGASLSDDTRVEHRQMKVYIYDAVNTTWWVNKLN